MLILTGDLQGFLKPLPKWITPLDIDYLFVQGALSLPDAPLQNALLQSFFEFVHPYMPFENVHKLLKVLEDKTGKSGKISLLLFQAFMFAGTAFVDIKLLKTAGYSNRRAARKAFFQRVKVCIL